MLQYENALNQSKEKLEAAQECLSDGAGLLVALQLGMVGEDFNRLSPQFGESFRSVVAQLEAIEAMVERSKAALEGISDSWWISHPD